MARKKQDSNAPPAPAGITTDRRPTRYVVVREGHRVSANEYGSPEDPQALGEVEFWQKVASRHSWGEPVQVVIYDNKLHRVW